MVYKDELNEYDRCARLIFASELVSQIYCSLSSLDLCRAVVLVVIRASTSDLRSSILLSAHISWHGDKTLDVTRVDDYTCWQMQERC